MGPLNVALLKKAVEKKRQSKGFNGNCNSFNGNCYGLCECLLVICWFILQMGLEHN